MAEEESPLTEKTEPFYLSKFFSFTHFHQPLNECLTLIELAKFGFLDIEMKPSEEIIIQNRIDAIKKLLHKLLMIIKNSEPFMDKMNGTLIKNEFDNIKRVEKVFDAISKPIIDQRINIQAVEVNEEHFKNCLDELIEICTKIKIPLNNMGFIYPKGDETEMGEWEKRFKEGQ